MTQYLPFGNFLSLTQFQGFIPENTPAQITAAQNNYAIGNYTVLRLDTDASRAITGMTGGFKGRILIIINVGAQDIVFANNSASSAVGNKIITGTGADVTITTTKSIIFYYDKTSAVWRLIAT